MNRTPDSRAHLAREAAALFRRRYGREPVAFAAAPGRVNLMGDHTDYNEGFVLPMALDRCTVVAGAIRQDDNVCVASTAQGGATGERYVRAVAEELRALGGMLPGVDVAVSSDVPIGAGLSSSAALTVATATMLVGLTGRTLAPLEKAKLCQRAEHAVGAPCGIMDMFVATHAREGCALLLDCRTLEYQHVQLQGALIIVNTGVSHALADGAYAKRRASCECAARKLGVSALRDATVPQLDSSSTLTDEERRRARHVVTENARVQLAATALQGGDLETVGRLMFESHHSLAQDYDVSCAELDAVVEAVQSNHSNLGFGARMTGAGFGGCAIVVCEAAHVDETVVNLEQALRPALGDRMSVFRAVPGSAACQLGSA